MNTLEQAAAAALTKSLGVREQETVLVVTDGRQPGIAMAFLAAARELGGKAGLLEIQPGREHGEEPSDEVRESLIKADVAVLVTSVSLSHTAARRAATEAGTRMASMPGITEDIMLRCIDVDYERMRERTNRLADMLDAGNRVEVTTPAGTVLAISIEGRRAHGRRAGIFTAPGAWGNLPEGEACIGPTDGTAEGVYVVDASISHRRGLLERPIIVEVQSGKAVRIEGDPQLEKLLRRHGDDAFTIAEMGIGTNDLAGLHGTTLEDEKTLGTCHIALGNNTSLDGSVDVPIHIDGVMRSPTILVDRACIMKDGRPGASPCRWHTADHSRRLLNDH